MRGFWLLLGLFAAPAPAHAGLCALCRKTLEQSGNTGLIHGFYWSILLIGSIPLLVLLIGGGWLLRHLWLPRR